MELNEKKMELKRKGKWSSKGKKNGVKKKKNKMELRRKKKSS